MLHRLISARTPRAGPPMETAALQSVFLHVTKACNLHCSYCYFSARRPLPNEMTAREFAPIWSDMVKLGPRKLVFTGGEPLMRADLFELLEDFSAADPDRTIVRCVNSNGRLVTPEIARRLTGLADEVRISLDALPAANDALRGEGNFADAMRALEIYRDAGFEPKVLVTVTSRTLPDLETLIVMLVERGFRRINVNGLRLIGRGKGHDDWRVAHAEVRATVERAWARAFPEAMPRPEPPQEEAQHHCGVGNFLNIMPNGDVFPCHALTQPEFRAGNVRERRLIEICARSGLIGRLAKLDFVDLVAGDADLEPLTRAGTCMGHVYAGTKASPAWPAVLDGK